MAQAMTELPKGMLNALSLPQLKLTMEQEQEWTKARTKFLWEVPGFCAVMFNMMNPHAKQEKAVFTDTVPIAATDGLYMMLNPKTFLALPLPERVFAMAHEVVHAICSHPILMYTLRMKGKVAFSDGTSLPYHENVLQFAMDFVVNAMLHVSGIGRTPEWVLLDPAYRAGKEGKGAIITHKDTVVDAYRKLWNDMKCNGGAGKLGVDGRHVPGPATPEGNGGLSNKGDMECDGGKQRLLDQLMDPGTAEGKSAEQGKQERNETEWKTAVAAAMESARVQGRLPAAMQEMFGEILEPQVQWQEYIQGWAKRKLGGGAYNFRRADRRFASRNPFIYAPARSNFGVEHVVVAVDTSGSIGSAEVNMFFAEMMGILDDVRPEKITVMWCDAKVHRVDEIEDAADMEDMYHKGAPGRGGTSFVPVFERVREMGIRTDALVYLTDGHGTFPSSAPDYHVLWGSIDKQPDGYPWGEVVMVPKVGKQ